MARAAQEVAVLVGIEGWPMIRAVKKGSGGVPRAVGVCDGCGAEEVRTCDYERRGLEWIANEGQMRGKLRGMGRAHVRGRDLCPACTRAARARKVGTMGKKESGNVTELRQPSREQRRQIAKLLDDVYDVQAGRYLGGETDKTVAETIGGGVMPGWVAELREDMYGPDGGNDDLEALAAEMRDWQAKADLHASEAHDAMVAMTARLREFNEARETVKGYLSRLEAIRAAVGPKAARA